VHEERVDYFRRAVTTTAFFSFCSSLLFRRVLWERAPLDESFVGSCWAHVPRFFANLPHGLRVQYVKESRLFKRGDNDSFLEAGIVNRIGIAVDGFNRIADSLFGHDSEEAFHVRRTLRNEYSLAHLLYAKLRAHARGTHEDPGRLQQLVDKLCEDESVKNIASRTLYRLVPVSALGLAKRLLDGARRLR